MRNIKKDKLVRKGTQDVFLPAYCEHDWKDIINKNGNKRESGKEVMYKICKKCGLQVSSYKKWKRSKDSFHYESTELMTWDREGTH